MSDVNGVSLIFDGLRVLVVGGVLKWFFWDLFLKEYFDKAVEEHKKIIDSTLDKDN